MGGAGATGWFDEVIFYEPAKDLADMVLTAFSVAARLRRLNPERVFNLGLVQSRVTI